jgi:hypothetical protein
VQLPREGASCSCAEEAIFDVFSLIFALTDILAFLPFSKECRFLGSDGKKCNKKFVLKIV